MDSGMEISLNGIQTAQIQLDSAAERIASASVEPESSNVDMAQEMVNLVVAEDSTKANVTALKVQSEVIGSVLDLIV